MPLAWTAIYLMNIVNGANSIERESSVEKQDPERTASLGKLPLVRIISIPGTQANFLQIIEFGLVQVYVSHFNCEVLE